MMNRPHSILILALALLTSMACVVAAPPPQQTPPPVSPAFDPPTGVTVPAGTVFMVRMHDSVNTRRDRAGSRWTAVLEADLVAGDTTVAPRGSVVYGVLSQVDSSGRLIGRSSMTMQPTDLMIGSRMFPITTGEIQAAAENSAGGNTARRTARAAAVGGLIDGSDGAKTGAAVGLGASILSDDGQIEVAAGTLLQFPLAAPLAL